MSKERGNRNDKREEQECSSKFQRVYCKDEWDNDQKGANMQDNSRKRRQRDG